MADQAMTNEQLVQLAENGDTGPLLTKLRAGVPTSPGTDLANGDVDGAMDDDLWVRVMASDLPSNVMQECYDAVGAE